MNEYLEKTISFLKKLPVIGDWLERRPNVAVIRFAGVIADSDVKKNAISYSRYAKAIDKAFDKSRLQAVVLVINSPGGAASQTALIAGHIRQLADEKDIPVLAFVEDVAASGGYWLACAADEIYALETSIVTFVLALTFPAWHTMAARPSVPVVTSSGQSTRTLEEGSMVKSRLSSGKLPETAWTTS